MAASLMVDCSPASGIKSAPTVGEFGYDDYWIVKVDADGVLEWERTFGGEPDDHAATGIQNRRWWLCDWWLCQRIAGSESATDDISGDFRYPG